MSLSTNENFRQLLPIRISVWSWTTVSSRTNIQIIVHSRFYQVQRQKRTCILIDTNFNVIKCAQLFFGDDLYMINSNISTNDYIRSYLYFKDYPHYFMHRKYTIWISYRDVIYKSVSEIVYVIYWICLKENSNFIGNRRRTSKH